MIKFDKGFVKIRVPILNDEYAVYIIWGDEKKKLKWLRNHFEDDSIVVDDWKKNRAQLHARDGYQSVINIIDSKYFYSELAHEAVHAVDEIFNYIGDNNRYELFAHSVGAIVRSVEKYRNGPKIPLLKGKKIKFVKSLK